MGDQPSPLLPTLSSDELLRAVSRGDEAAFAELYDRTAPACYRLALHILRDRNLAEDAVQEAFAAVWRCAGTFRADRSRARAWLLTIVRRRAIDIVRKEEVRRTEPCDGKERGSTLGADGEVERDAAGATLRRALRTLPSGQRELLGLAYYGGYSQSEIANRLDQPLGTVKSRTVRALESLRVRLTEAGP